MRCRYTEVCAWFWGKTSNKRLYAGNLSFSLGDAELSDLFAEAYKVENVRVVVDVATGRKKCFGCVDMSTPEEVEKVVKMLGGSDVGGRSLVVDIARERPAREGGGVGLLVANGGVVDYADSIVGLLAGWE